MSVPWEIWSAFLLPKWGCDLQDKLSWIADFYIVSLESTSSLLAPLTQARLTGKWSAEQEFEELSAVWCLTLPYPLPLWLLVPAEKSGREGIPSGAFSMQILLQSLNVAIMALRNLNSYLENTIICTSRHTDTKIIPHNLPIPVNKSTLERLEENRIFIKLPEWEGFVRYWVTHKITKEKKLRDLTQKSFFCLQKKSKVKKPQSVKCVYKNDQRLIYLQHGKFI